LGSVRSGHDLVAAAEMESEPLEDVGLVVDAQDARLDAAPRGARHFLAPLWAARPRNSCSARLFHWDRRSPKPALVRKARSSPPSPSSAGPPRSNSSTSTDATWTAARTSRVPSVTRPGRC